MNNIVEEDIKKIASSFSRFDEDGECIHPFSGKRILLTGGCGFLGSWFVAVFQYLNSICKEKCKVIVIDSMIVANKKNKIVEVTDENISFIASPIERWSPGMLNILENENRGKESKYEKFDYIIHAAGIASPTHYRRYPIETIKGMVLGLINIMDYASEQPTNGILVFSSSEIYGDPHIVPTPETYNGNVSSIGPRSCYDESKRLQETICKVYAETRKVPVNVVRPFNVFGPGLSEDDYRVMSKFLFQSLKGESLTVHLPATQTRTFCYITDAMSGFFKVLLHLNKGEVFNIGTGGPEISMRDLANIIGTKTDCHVSEIPAPETYPLDQPQRRCPDLSKAENELNYEPVIPLEEGISRTYDWCKEQL